MTSQRPIPALLYSHRFDLVLVGITLALYSYCLCPGLYWGDSGEFALTARVLSIPHPPGYPLYTLLGRFFNFLPLGSPAWRVNLLSALTGTAGVFCLFRFLRSFLGTTVVPFIAALSFAVTPTFWSQTVVAEVYSLNLLFLSLGLYLADTFHRKGQATACLLLMYTMGLALTHHITFLLYLPVLVFLAGRGRWGQLRHGKVLRWGIFLFLLGLTPYLYLPLRSALAPYGCWQDLTQWRTFINYVSAVHYKSKLAGFNLPYLVTMVKQYGVTVIREYHPAWLLLAAVGFTVLLKNRRAAGVAGGILFTISVFFPLQYRIPDIEPYFIPSYLLLAIFMAGGMEFITRTIMFRAGNNPHRFLRMTAWVWLIVPLLAAGRNFEGNNKRKQDFTKTYGQQVLNSLKPNSLLFATNDNLINTVNYLQQIEQLRPDVIHINRALLSYPYYYTRRYFPYGLQFPSYAQARRLHHQHLVYNRMAQSELVRGDPDWVNNLATSVIFKNQRHYSAYWELGGNNNYIFPFSKPHQFLLEINKKYLKGNRKPSQQNGDARPDTSDSLWLHWIDTNTKRLDDFVAKLGGGSHLDRTGRQAVSYCYLMTGEYYLDKGFPAQAKAMFDRSLAIAPENLTAYNYFAKYYKRTKDYAWAEQALRTSLSDHTFTDKEIIHAELGQLAFIQKKWDQALTHFTRALDYKPDYFIAQKWIAMCRAEKGELPEAIRLLQDLVTQVPYYTLAYVDLGVCNEKQALRLEQESPSADRAGTADYYKKAEYYYKKALSLQRNCRPARYNLQRLWQEGKIDSLKNTVPKNGMPSLPDKP